MPSASPPGDAPATPGAPAEDAPAEENGSAAPSRPGSEAGSEPAGALPDRFADGTMRKLEPEIRTIWMLKLGAALLLLVGAVFFYEIVRWLGGSGGAWQFWLSGVLLVVSGVATVAIPRLRYRYWRYALRPEELYLERGVFNRVRTVVPLRRIQHLDVSQDLFEREFDLGKLIVHTAGGRSSDVAVPGLRYETAERLRDDVKHYVLDDAV